MMTSPRISTLVVDIFTRSFVIPNDLSFIFIRKPNGDRSIGCIPAIGSNNRPLFISVEEFIKIINIVAAWVMDECLLSDASRRSEISDWRDSENGSNRIYAAFSSCDNIKSLDVRNYWRPIDGAT